MSGASRSKAKRDVCPFTVLLPSCYIGGKPKGPVLENAKHAEVAAPTVKRGFVTPKFMGLVRLGTFVLTVTGGMGLPVRMAARLRACFQHPVHLMRLKTRWWSPRFTQESRPCPLSPRPAAALPLHRPPCAPSTLFNCTPMRTMR